jgi:hypothetical protein
VLYQIIFSIKLGFILETSIFFYKVYSTEILGIMTFSIIGFNKWTSSIIFFSITRFNIMAFSKAIFSISLFSIATLNIT